MKVMLLHSTESMLLCDLQGDVPSSNSECQLDLCDVMSYFQLFIFLWLELK